ncbi:MAG: M1 family aminopeptidase [Acidobacteriota bacterium]|nr:M1 family aminopeptidase [Acidobacteriota bacterium]
MRHAKIHGWALVVWAVLLGFAAGPAFANASRPDVRTTALQIVPVRYDLDLRPDFKAGRLAGDCRLTIRNASDRPADVIPLLLYRLFKVTSLKDEAGRDLPFEHTVESFSDWDVLQAGFIRVRPPAPLAPSATAVLHIAYEGALAGYPEAMAYVRDKVDPAFAVFRMETFAYPQPGVPCWEINRAAGLPEFSYRVRTAVPESLTVANGGRLAERTVRDGQAVYVYEGLRPDWRIDVAVAPYRILRDERRPLRVYHFADDAAGAARVMAGMKAAMDLFAGWFGPLPGGDFSVIEVPEGYGSQADYTVVLQTRDAFLDPDKIDTLYHEISHLWNVPARDPLPPRFESEGLAMFLQALARERLDGRADAVAARVARSRESFRKAAARDAKLAGIPMIDYGKAQRTDASYTKGMVFFALLHEILGEEAFLAGVRSFVGTYREKGATAAQFLKHFSDASPADLASLYRDWVTGAASSEFLSGTASFAEILGRYRPSGR